MKYSILEYYISQPRLDRFLIASTNNKTKAQKHYRANLRVAQSFYPLLNLFEIALRNSIHQQMSFYFANPDWIISERNGFMNDRSLHSSRYFLKNSIMKAERKIHRRGSVTSGKIIAEQSFGFWTSLFEPHHYRLIGGCVIHVFRNKPRSINRSIISQKLNRIREFRNRIYHNEPICFNGSHIDYTNSISILNEINELLEWMNPELQNYVSYYDSIHSKVQIANDI